MYVGEQVDRGWRVGKVGNIPIVFSCLFSVPSNKLITMFAICDPSNRVIAFLDLIDL